MFYLFWLPIYLKDKYDVDIKDIVHFALPLIIIYSMTTIGSVGGDWLSSQLIKKGWPLNRARKTTMFFCALAALPVIAVKFVDLWPAVFLLRSSRGTSGMVGEFAHHAVGHVSQEGGRLRYEHRHHGRVYRRRVFQVLCGFVINSFRAKHDVETGYLILFIMCASAYLTALLIFHLLAPKMEVVDI